MFGMPNIDGGRRNDPALMAAQGRCPRIPASSSPRRFGAPERCRRSTARRPPSMFGVPNITEVDGTIPPSWPHKDVALGIPASTSPRRFAAPGALRSIGSSEPSIDVRHAEHYGGRPNDPVLVAAHGLCPRIPASSSPRRFAAPEPCRRSTARRPPSMFGVPNITEVDGTIPPSWPREDIALEVSTSSCDRHLQATETENSFRSRSKPPRPLHGFFTAPSSRRLR